MTPDVPCRVCMQTQEMAKVMPAAQIRGIRLICVYCRAKEQQHWRNHDVAALLMAEVVISRVDTPIFPIVS